MPLPSIFGCYDLGNCNFTGNMFGTMLMPYQWTLGSLAPVAFWGIIIAVLWTRMQNTMHLSIIGIIISAGLITFYEPARQMGWLLVALAAGLTLYQLVTNRIHHGASM